MGLEPMRRTDPGFIDRQNRLLERASPQEILDLALYLYGPEVAISTAFGVEGCALIHMAVQIDPALQVFTVDTGLLFDETQELKRRLVEAYDLSITTFEPELSVAEQAAEHGDALWEREPERCCAMRKVEPTSRALSGLDGWIAGLRRDQGPSRAGIPIFQLLEQSPGRPIVKIHPLANWTRSDVWSYVLEHEVPYNPLLDEGYKSIGCTPCTAPVSAGDSERAGRWGGQRQECGIHTFLPPQDLVKKRA